MKKLQNCSIVAKSLEYDTRKAGSYVALQHTYYCHVAKFLDLELAKRLLHMHIGHTSITVERWRFAAVEGESDPHRASVRPARSAASGDCRAAGS